MTGAMIMFIDIETIREYERFLEMPEDGRKAFYKKLQKKFEEGIEMVEQMEGLPMTTMYGPAQDQKIYEDNCSFNAEFARIACISMGYMTREDPLSPNPTKVKIKTLYSTQADSEASMLQNFANWLKGFDFLAAHNGKEFDFPFISRRMMKHGIRLPRLLDNRYKKPWETSLIDTIDIWKSGSYSGKVSLASLAYMFGLPSPKDAIDGSMVYFSYRDGMHDTIATYCAGDVSTLINVYRKMGCDPIFTPDQIENLGVEYDVQLPKS